MEVRIIPHFLSILTFFDRFAPWRTSQGSGNHSNSQANVAEDVL